MVTSADIRAREIGTAYREYAQTGVLQMVADGRRMVLGAGPRDAPIVIVGEAPGALEEQQGEPFVGPAGQELQKLCRRAEIGWDFCYRANVLPWRPPGNRTPYPFEITASRPRLLREIEVIRPEIVIAAGATAWKALAGGLGGSFADARGKWGPWSPAGHEFSCDLLAIHHPSAILHAHGQQREVMRDETVTALRSVLRGDCAG